MNRNVGNTERIFRVLFGLFIISLAFWGPKSMWAFIGIVPVITGLVGYCSPYALLGISTCKRKREKPSEA